MEHFTVQIIDFLLILQQSGKRLVKENVMPFVIGVNTSLKYGKFTKKYTPIKRLCFALQNIIVPDLSTAKRSA